MRTEPTRSGNRKCPLARIAGLRLPFHRPCGGRSDGCAPPFNILCLYRPGADKAVDQDDEALTSGNLLMSATFKNLKCLMLEESSFSRR
jgi:hypothetical protein